MNKAWMFLLTGMSVFTLSAGAAGVFPVDRMETGSGILEITLVGHGTLMMKYQGKVIHIDPWTRLGDYTAMPKADLILVTHGHMDHFDPSAMEMIKKEGTVILLPKVCAKGLGGEQVLANGESKTVAGLLIEAVPAYNIVHMRAKDTPFHPKGEGNGYIITFGDKRVYVAGDTENTPEMKALKNIDAAFLPMNLPYTMSPEMVADAVRAFRPRIVYPYHYGPESMTGMGEMIKTELQGLIQDVKGVDVRVPAAAE